MFHINKKQEAKIFTSSIIYIKILRSNKHFFLECCSMPTINNCSSSRHDSLRFSLFLSYVKGQFGEVGTIFLIGLKGGTGQVRQTDLTFPPLLKEKVRRGLNSPFLGCLKGQKGETDLTFHPDRDLGATIVSTRALCWQQVPSRRLEPGEETLTEEEENGSG